MPEVPIKESWVVGTGEWNFSVVSYFPWWNVYSFGEMIIHLVIIHLVKWLFLGEIISAKLKLSGLNYLGTQCPDIWSNIIINISMRMFNMFASWFWVKQITLPMWVGLIQLVQGFNRTKTGLSEERRNSTRRCPSDLTCNPFLGL